MSRYRVVLSEKAERQLDGQLDAVRDKALLRALRERILALGGDPRPAKLQGRYAQWRVGERDWRIVYLIEGEEGSGLGPIRPSGGATEPTNARSASGGLRLVVLVVSVAKRDEGER